jgi:hypothetical protein
MWTAFPVCLALATLCSTSVAMQDAVNGVIPGPPTFYQWVLPLAELKMRAGYGYMFFVAELVAL